METSFPLNSVIFDTAPIQNDKLVDCFTDVYEFKRIESVFFDEQRKVFVVKMHEKVYDRLLYNNSVQS